MKKSFFKKVLFGILWFLLGIFIVLVLWFSFSALHKKNSLEMIPRGYSVFLHADSAWKALDPLVDLRAADLFLASADFFSLRGPFMNYRSSKLRSNKLFAFAASRKVDGAFYTGENGKNDFVAVVNLSFLSGITRLSNFILPKLNIKNLSFVETNGLNFYKFSDGKNSYYIKPYRNLLIISSDFNLFSLALNANNAESYTKSQKSLLLEKDNQALKFVVDAKKIASDFAQDNQLLQKITSLLSADSLSSISFNITDSEIGIKANFPFSFTQEMQNSSEYAGFSELLNQKIVPPSLVGKMSNLVQYYTLINSLSLEQLKNAFLPFMQEDKGKDLWKKANSLCKTLFSLSLEELLFSWTGDEFAVMGVEGLKEPVFAIQILDEQKRQEIFNKVLSSIVIRDDTSLILNGVRLPKLMLPDFLKNLLVIFGVNIPSPYYMIYDDFIYFSQSPETLSVIFTSVENGKRIAKNPNWQSVSSVQKRHSCVSFFYDLERSVPFFLSGTSDVSKVLRLYSIGRADVSFKNSEISFQLQAVSRRSGDLRSIPGFPINVDGILDSELFAENVANPSRIFWVENKNIVKSMNVSSTEVKELFLYTKTWIVPTSAKSKSGKLWAVTADGLVYLLTNNLQIEEGFPVKTLVTPVSAPNTVEDSVVFATDNKKLCYVKADGYVSFAELSSNSVVNPTISVLDKTVAVYEKGFIGKIFLFEEEMCLNRGRPLNISGIGFGSPALMKKTGTTYTGFITQSGSFYLWEGDQLAEGFPIKLDGVFYTNAVSNGKYFFALSDSGQLFRISLDGKVLSVVIPWCSAKEGRLTATSPDSNGVCNVYAGIDGNLIYGFNEKLELLSGFPLLGYGKPVFADVNADRYADCFVISVDGKINAWNLR